MTLRSATAPSLRRGLGETTTVEEELLFPLLKGSDIASKRTAPIDRYLIVPQRAAGDDTTRLRDKAPRAWAYLESHRELFERRGSSVYRNRPPFSVFGVGAYTFAPWKLAICGLYKRVTFSPVGPYEEKPVVFDDTVYSIGCQTPEEASLLLSMLTSEAANRFFQGHVFWDSKRPITAEVLNRLDLLRLAEDLGIERSLVEAPDPDGKRAVLFQSVRMT